MPEVYLSKQVRKALRSGKPIKACCPHCGYDTLDLRTGDCSYCIPLPSPVQPKDTRA